MLTIGRLAAHAGVTVRAVRHYHQRGLLAEPERDASGYRRYGAMAVVDLIKIKTLSDAGVPLARIEELLRAGPGEFAAAVAEIGRDLDERISALTRHRGRVAELASGDRLFLPPEIIGVLDDLRELGVSDRMLQIERDVWIMVAALSPESVPEWVRTKDAAMADPGFRRLYLAIDASLTWSPDDPRLPGLAKEILDWDAAHPDRGSTRSALESLMFSHAAESSPAWRRLIALLPSSVKS